MKASLTIDSAPLHRIAQQFKDPVIAEEINRILQKKALVAIVAQAIADNFNQEGPGWAPLKPDTIRRSVSQAVRQSLSHMTNEQLTKHEEKARKMGSEPARRILRRTGLLMKTVTVPGFKGSGKSGNKSVSGGNVWKVEGHNLIWGTDLIYAGVHNNGDPARGIPKREFLTIRKEWLKQLEDFVAEEAFKIIWQRLGGNE